MAKWKLWLVGYVTMFAALGIAVAIVVIFDGGYWAFVPMVLWFVYGQIFLVPRILSKRNSVDNER